MRRTKLTPGSGGSRPRRRRHSATAATAATHADIFTPDRDTGYAGQVTFLPLRQVLDGRVKRRIRRNGLSEEMNFISAERRRRTQRTVAEMDALRAEVAAKNAEIRRLSGGTEVARTEDDEDDDEAESMDDLKKQAGRLRRALRSPAPSSRATNEDEDGGYDTSGSTRVGDQDSANCLEMDVDFDDDDAGVDHFFGDEDLAEIACSTPSRRPADFRNSILTPPSSTSPLARLATPLFRPMSTPTSTSDAGVQVRLRIDDDDEEELASLHLELEKLTGTLESYEALTRRLSDKLSSHLSPGSGGGGGSAADAILGSRSPAVRVEAQLNKLLSTLSARTASLSALDASLSALGFDGDDGAEVVASLAGAFRSARLELEYLDPGESALPLSAGGAAVLDLLLSRLRELSRRGREAASEADEHRATEARLRGQLAARVGAMDEMRAEAGVLRGKVRLRNARIAELEAGMGRLRGTVRTYTRDVAELEALARALEGDLDAAKRELREGAGRRREREEEEGDAEERWHRALKERDETIVLLEERLGAAMGQTSELREQMASLQWCHEEMEGRHRVKLESMREQQQLLPQHGSDSASPRDTRVDKLELEVEEVSGALSRARETIRKLREENVSLGGQLDAERSKSRAVLDTVKAELERAVRVGERLMEGTPPKSPVRD